MRLLVAVLCFCLLCFHQLEAKNLKRWEINGLAQGTTYSIIYYDDDEKVNKSEIDSVLCLMDRSMSLYREGSIINQFNQPSSTSIQMDVHMSRVIRTSFRMYKKSDYQFDITVKPLVDLWGFGAKKNHHEPEENEISSVLKRVGMHLIKVERQRLIKKSDLVSIDLNGIAQGYTVDELGRFLKKKRIKSFLIELGGEIIVEGKKPDGRSYNIAIQRPNDADVKDHVISLNNRAITTSGSYEKQRIVRDKLVSHHINPKTGHPVSSPTVSATVIAKRAMDADAWDNVMIALEPQEAIQKANRLRNIEVYILYKNTDGTLEEVYSKGFKKYLN